MARQNAQAWCLACCLAALLEERDPLAAAAAPDGQKHALHNRQDCDLTRRLAVTGSGDEFDNLALSLNEMLDRIEALMTGLKEVSDNIAHDLKTPLTRLRNKAVKSELKTLVRKTREAVATGDAEGAEKAFAAASRKLDKAVSKGVIHKNQAANRKSKLAAAVNKLGK